MEEKELVESLKRNDKKAQEEFVKKYSGFIYNITLQILRRKDLAEDVTEDVLITALKKIGNFRGESKLSTWLYRIASNRSKQIIFSEIKEKSLKERIAETIKQNDSVPSEYKKNKKKEIIWKGMELLKDSDKKIITLIDIQGLKYDEAAEILDIPIGTVRSRISRARERLKKIIEERNFFEKELSNK